MKNQQHKQEARRVNNFGTLVLVFLPGSTMLRQETRKYFPQADRNQRYLKSHVTNE